MKEYDCYLFDADGTLIDTTELIHHCFRYTLGKQGVDSISREEIVGHIGLPLRAQMEVYLGTLSDSDYERIRKMHMEYQVKIYPEYLTRFPGVAECLDSLQKRGKSMAVVTSRLKDTLELYLRQCALDSYFPVCITPEDTQKHKPDPEPVRLALQRLEADPGSTLFVGDSNFDIACGNAAGVDTCFVTWSHNRIDSLTAQPTWTISQMQELV
jgi:pyrophosphatase PpaX